MAESDKKEKSFWRRGKLYPLLGPLAVGAGYSSRIQAEGRARKQKIDALKEMREYEAAEAGAEVEPDYFATPLQQPMEFPSQDEPPPALPFSSHGYKPREEPTGPESTQQRSNRRLYNWVTGRGFSEAEAEEGAEPDVDASAIPLAGASLGGHSGTIDLEPVDIVSDVSPGAYGFMKRSQFSGVPEHLRPDIGFKHPHYPSMLREAIELGIVSVEDGRKLYEAYDKFKNTPEGEMLAAKRDEDFAKGQQARFGMEVSDMEADKLDRMASQWENYDQKARRLEAERQAYMEEFRSDYAHQMDSYKMAMDDLRRTHMPRKSWSDKLMAGIAVALGALGSAVARTPNYPLQILMKNIDSEMAAFQTDLKRKRGLVFMEGNLLGEMRSRLKSEDAAYSATRQFLMQDTVNKIKAVQASSDSAVIRKKADAAIAAISAEIQVENQKIQAKLHGAAQQAAMMAAMGARRTAAAKAQQEAMGGFTPLDKKEELIFGGASVGDWALTEGSKVGSVGLRNLRKSVAGTKTELSVAQELISHLKRGFPTDPAGIYRMKQLSTMMLSAVIRERGANLTELEVKLLRAMSGGDPGSLTYNVFQKMQPAMLKGVQRFAKWRKDKTHDELKTAGFRQVQTKRVMTEKGVRTLKKEMPELWVVQPEVQFQSQ